MHQLLLLLLPPTACHCFNPKNSDTISIILLL
jgi:hypothetical protein